MPKKQHNETKAEQIERFRAEVARLIDAGDLDPEKADVALNRLLTEPLKKAGVVRANPKDI